MFVYGTQIPPLMAVADRAAETVHSYAFFFVCQSKVTQCNCSAAVRKIDNDGARKIFKLFLRLHVKARESMVCDLCYIARPLPTHRDDFIAQWFNIKASLISKQR